MRSHKGKRTKGDSKKDGNSRILIVLDTTHGQIGGTEQNSLRFAQALARRGYEPIVAEIGNTILSKSEEDAKDLQMVNIKASHFDDVGWREWWALFKKTRPSVIIRSKTWIGCHNWKLDIIAYLSLARYFGWEHHPASDPRTKMAEFTSINQFWFQSKSRIKKFFRIQLHIRSVHRTVTVSNAVRAPLIRFYPAVPNKVDTIYPGVDFNFFKKVDAAREEKRAAWGIPERAFVIGSVGRLVAHKGNDFTLQVLAELLKNDPALNVWCVLAGSGPDLPRLQKLAETLEISERVRFPGWQENAPETWSALDLFLMPSSDEGLGMTLIEAVACGCLLIGTSAGGMKEILTGPLRNYCLPPLDVKAWTMMSADMIAMSPSERAQLHQDIYNHIRQKFDSSCQWGLMVDWVRLHAGKRLSPSFAEKR